MLLIISKIIINYKEITLLLHIYAIPHKIQIMYTNSKLFKMRLLTNNCELYF